MCRATRQLRLQGDPLEDVEAGVRGRGGLRGGFLVGHAAQVEHLLELGLADACLLTAEGHFRLRFVADDGQLREGFWADIVVFDPEKIQDTASYKSPHHYPTGIIAVLVNGVTVFENGEHTGAKAGQALRNPRALPASGGSQHWK